MMNKKRNIPTLSKSRFMAGVQCHKRLFLECYNNDLADPVDAGRQAIFDSGKDVGILARSLYSGGILIEADFMHFGEALKITKEALAQTTVRALPGKGVRRPMLNHGLPDLRDFGLPHPTPIRIALPRDTREKVFEREVKGWVWTVIPEQFRPKIWPAKGK